MLIGTHGTLRLLRFDVSQLCANEELDAPFAKVRGVREEAVLVAETGVRVV